MLFQGSVLIEDAAGVDRMPAHAVPVPAIEMGLRSRRALANSNRSCSSGAPNRRGFPILDFGLVEPAGVIRVTRRQGLRRPDIVRLGANKVADRARNATDDGDEQSGNKDLELMTPFHATTVILSVSLMLSLTSLGSWIVVVSLALLPRRGTRLVRNLAPGPKVGMTILMLAGTLATR